MALNHRLKADRVSSVPTTWDRLEAEIKTAKTEHRGGIGGHTIASLLLRQQTRNCLVAIKDLTALEYDLLGSLVESSQDASSLNARRLEMLTKGRLAVTDARGTVTVVLQALAAFNELEAT